MASQVRLLVNRGEPALTYVMPDVAGADGEHAADALRQQGLRVAMVATLPVTDSRPAPSRGSSRPPARRWPPPTSCPSR